MDHINTEDSKQKKDFSEKEGSFQNNILNDSEEKFKILFDYLDDGACISDLNGNIVEGNPVVEKTLGYDRGELVGKNFLQIGLLSSKDISRALKSLSQNRKDLPTGPEEYTFLKKDKKPIEVEISSFPLKLNGEKYSLAIIKDLSRRRHYEMAFKNSEQEKSVILDSSPTHTLCRDKDYNIIWANKTACNYFGKELNEIVGMKCHEAWRGSASPCQGCPVDRIWHTGEIIKAERKTKDGRYWYLSDAPLKNEKGEVVAIIQNVLDITDQKEAQDKLKKIIEAIIETIFKIMGVRDPYTAEH